jgi:hypothetical protein
VVNCAKVAKTGIQTALKAIAKVLDEFPDGLSLDEIKSKLPFEMESYTLQRRLAKLKEQGTIRMEGEKRAAVYYPTVVGQGLPEGRSKEPSIPISYDSRIVLELVNRPLSSRKAVLYHPEFLENYIPNKSSYLSVSDKEQLASSGQTPRPFEPAGTYARNILNRLLIDLSWNSSRLEGNTYSLLDTERLIKEGEKPESRSVKETQMILNHKEAIEFLVESAGEIGFNRYSILNLHAILSTNLLDDPVASGRIRSHGVGIHGSVYTPPAIPQQINEWFDMLLGKAAEIRDPFEQAFFVMVHLPYLQPFDDVNKRVSRLAANIPLIQHNLSPISFIDVPADLYISGLIAVYELNDVGLLRDVFMWAYRRSAARYGSIRHTVGEPDPFRLRYREEIRRIIGTVIKDMLGRAQASYRIRMAAAELPEADRETFINAVELELFALHEGNFARYRVTPSQFRDWQVLWTRQ